MRAYFESHRAELTKSGWSGFGKSLGLIKGSEGLRWANTLDVKTAVEQVYLEAFGEKSAGNVAALNAAKDKVRVRSISLVYRGSC